MNLPKLAITLVAGALLATQALAACNIVDGKPYGECTAVQVNSASKGTLNVNGSHEESSIVDGANVHAGGKLQLSGISNGDIIVHAKGTLLVTGVVSGTVRNEGGSISIDGTVNRLESSGGSAQISGIVGTLGGSGPVTIHKGAILSGIPTERERQWP